MSAPTVHSMRAARQLDAAAVDVARADAARQRAEADAAAQTAQLRAARERAQVDAELREIAEGERERRTVRRREARARQWAARRQVVTTRSALLASVSVIALFVTVALPAQISFLAQRWPWPMALAGGIALEALTWVFALQGRTREARGLSAAVHSAGIWGAAFVAAGINLTHGAQLWGGAFAVVAACGSLAAPLTWHMYLISQRHQGLTPKQAHAERRRRRHHRKVARIAERLASALPSGLDVDRAWTLAWHAVHGAEPGVTADLLRSRGKAAAEVAKHLPPGGRPDLSALLRPVPVLTLPSAVRDTRGLVAAAFDAAVPIAELLEPSVYIAEPGAAARPVPSLSPRTGAYNQLSARTPTLQPGARSARTTAVQPPADDSATEAKRLSARAKIRRILALGGTPSPTEIGREHGMSPEWGSKQIRAVRTA